MTKAFSFAIALLSFAAVSFTIILLLFTAGCADLLGVEGVSYSYAAAAADGTDAGNGSDAGPAVPELGDRDKREAGALLETEAAADASTDSPLEAFPVDGSPDAAKPDASAPSVCVCSNGVPCPTWAGDDAGGPLMISCGAGHSGPKVCADSFALVTGSCHYVDFDQTLYLHWFCC
jgi:hypothetical protein